MEEEAVATEGEAVATEEEAVATEEGAVATEEVAVATEEVAVATEEVEVATEEEAVATEEEEVAMEERGARGSHNEVEEDIQEGAGVVATTQLDTTADVDRGHTLQDSPVYSYSEVSVQYIRGESAWLWSSYHYFLTFYMYFCWTHFLRNKIAC